jgi:hypothetical protein
MIGLGHLDMSKLFSSMMKKVILNMINLGSTLNLPDKNNLGLQSLLMDILYCFPSIFLTISKTDVKGWYLKFSFVLGMHPLR